jgi:hypothetical protein
MVLVSTYYSMPATADPAGVYVPPMPPVVALLIAEICKPIIITAGPVVKFAVLVMLAAPVFAATYKPILAIAEYVIAPALLVTPAAPVSVSALPQIPTIADPAEKNVDY